MDRRSPGAMCSVGQGQNDVGDLALDLTLSWQQPCLGPSSVASTAADPKWPHPDGA